MALGFDPSPLDELEKFDPDQPRVPAGSGRASGQWTREIEAVAAAAAASVARELPQAASVASRLVGIGARALAAVGASAAGIAGTAAFVTAMVISTPAGGKRTRGKIEGHPDLFYVWSSDETQLRIVRQSDNRELVNAFLKPDGTLWQGKKLIGRKRDDRVVIYPFVPPLTGTESDTQEPPRLCPKDTPDRSGRPGPQGEKDRDYEDFMKRFVNPDRPTERGFAYLFTNPATASSAMIDDCQQTTGDPYEAKGTGYAAMLAKDVDPITRSLDAHWIGQATRQLDAAPGRVLHWCFAEKAAADHAERLFSEHADDKRLGEIKICRLYWKGDAR